MRGHAIRVLLLILIFPAFLVPAGGNLSAVDQEPRLVIEIHIQQDGDALWNISMHFNLSSRNETAAFDRLAKRFKSGEANFGFSINTFRQAARKAENRTGRSMHIQNISRVSSIIAHGKNATANATGILSLTFVWTNFAQVSGTEIQVGDAFGDQWQLKQHQILRFYPPSGYNVHSVSPSTKVSGGVITWVGPQTFSAKEPAIVYISNQEQTPPRFSPIGFVYGAGIFIALIGGGLGVYIWLRRGRIFMSSPSTNSTQSEPDQTDTTITQEPDQDIESVDPELLSDEERIEQLLKQHGGRMKQSNIVEETKWSNAKVSQLLSSMEEEGQINKLRIGRENLITLPDENDSEDEI
ncbi:MAG: helix-turn-helix transcriptional regulator [Halobacteriaceae archaeon]